MHQQVICHIIAFLVVVVWGSTFVFTKLLLMDGLSPANIFTLRFAIAYVLVLVFSLFQPQHQWTARTVKDELLLAAIGVSGGSLYFLAENAALSYTTTTNTSLIVCLCPLFAALLISLFYQSERLHGVQILGSIMAAVGVVIVVLNGHFVLHLSPKGDALAFLACMCWALYSLLMIPASRKYDALLISRKTFFYGLLTMIPYYLFFSDPLNAARLLQPATLLRLLFLGVIASTLCYYLWSLIIRRIGAVVTTNYVYFNPVVTILCAWIVLDEHITLWLLLGTLLILLGMYLANKKLVRQAGATSSP